MAKVVIGSASLDMLYKYYRNCSGICMESFVTLWLQVVQPLANVHETKWTPQVKRQSDVAQSCKSSGFAIETSSIMPN